MKTLGRGKQCYKTVSLQTFSYEKFIKKNLCCLLKCIPGLNFIAQTNFGFSGGFKGKLRFYPHVSVYLCKPGGEDEIGGVPLLQLFQNDLFRQFVFFISLIFKFICLVDPHLWPPAAACCCLQAKFLDGPQVLGHGVGVPSSLTCLVMQTADWAKEDQNSEESKVAHFNSFFAEKFKVRKELADGTNLSRIMFTLLSGLRTISRYVMCV